MSEVVTMTRPSCDPKRYTHFIRYHQTQRVVIVYQQLMLFNGGALQLPFHIFTHVQACGARAVYSHERSRRFRIWETELHVVLR
jgi:hypothetical protein